MKTAGTETKWETFEVTFLYFNHKTQRWLAELLIGAQTAPFRAKIRVGSKSGMDWWYLIGFPDVRVPRKLCNYLARMTNATMLDCMQRIKYREATGSMPADLLH